MSNNSGGAIENAKNIWGQIKNFNERVILYYIIPFVCAFIIAWGIYKTVRILNLQKNQCSLMEQAYNKNNSYITSINENTHTYKLCDYYIKSAYNACSGGDYKNDYVNLCNLKSIIKTGARCFDFEVYSFEDEPIVSTSTTKDFFIKETFNYVKFSDALATINDRAFSEPSNYEDPVIIHMRIKSTNPKIYDKLGDLFRGYASDTAGHLLGSEYSYASKNIGDLPLITFKNKIIVIVDGDISNQSYVDTKFHEYINLVSNVSDNVWLLRYSTDVVNAPDLNDLIEHNRNRMAIVLPDMGMDPVNPSSAFCRAAGCQMTAMRYQRLQDEFLEIDHLNFDKCKSAFDLKPASLRSKPVEQINVVKQREELSYETREVSTDFYKFNI